MLIDLSALRDALGWLKSLLTTGAMLIHFAPLKLESETPSRK
jgi:hypothetical protein